MRPQPCLGAAEERHILSRRQKLTRHQIVYVSANEKEILQNRGSSPAEQGGVKESSAAQETKGQFAIIPCHDDMVEVLGAHPRPYPPRSIKAI